eukprot:gnl/MRDRNA2_/MRDRNA2_90352_c0_seq1.p1 gnl/MRDRNA2_/MRDRNA2_90352_c0~~gnl/MRDRNA2_/MRDRNA2_90352_c0_seq1.p1  ORF type:complete len:1028 (+),score=180.40 gnl/MRDRNA2_/MRDRNA2_90352_c0_seq1:88-3171(+)
MSKQLTERRHSTSGSSSAGIGFRVPIHFKFLKNLGSGSYGVVSAFRDDRTKKEVAIKRVRRVADDFLVLRRTLRELKLMQHFDHCNVLKLIEILPPHENGDLYMVLELMDVDLDKMIHSKSWVLRETDVRSFTFQMLMGLLHLHTGHVLHRDLKPSNIFLKQNGNLKLGDLGLARAVCLDKEGEAIHPDRERLTEYVVTRWYRAPEVLLDKAKYGPPVDVWSVGCILHEMWTKKVLFAGKNSYDQLKMVQIMQQTCLGRLSPEDMAWVPEHSRNLLDQTKPTASEMKPMRLGSSSTSKDGQDLLCGMLAFSPTKRSSVEHSLQHPYLKDLYTDQQVVAAKAIGQADAEYDRQYDDVTRRGRWEESKALATLADVFKREVNDLQQKISEDKEKNNQRHKRPSHVLTSTGGVTSARKSMVPEDGEHSTNSKPGLDERKLQPKRHSLDPSDILRLDASLAPSSSVPQLGSEAAQDGPTIPSSASAQSLGVAAVELSSKRSDANDNECPGAPRKETALQLESSAFKAKSKTDATFAQASHPEGSSFLGSQRWRVEPEEKNDDVAVFGQRRIGVASIAGPARRRTMADSVQAQREEEKIEKMKDVEWAKRTDEVRKAMRAHATAKFAASEEATEARTLTRQESYRDRSYKSEPQASDTKIPPSSTAAAFTAYMTAKQAARRASTGSTSTKSLNSSSATTHQSHNPRIGADKEKFSCTWTSERIERASDLLDQEKSLQHHEQDRVVVRSTKSAGNLFKDVAGSIEPQPKAATPPAVAATACEGVTPRAPPTPLAQVKNKVSEAAKPAHLGPNEVSKSLKSLEEALKALKARDWGTGSSESTRTSEGKPLAGTRASTRGQSHHMHRRSDKDLHNRGCTPPRDRTPPPARQSWLSATSGREPSRARGSDSDVASAQSNGASSVHQSMGRSSTPPRTVAAHSQALAEDVARKVRAQAEGRARVWRASTGGSAGLEYSSRSRGTTPPRKHGSEDGAALLSGLAAMSKTHTSRGTAGLPCGGGGNTTRSAREPPRNAW